MTYVLLLVMLGATPTITDICNSAAPSGNTAEINADCKTLPGDATAAKVYYSANDQSSWTELPMSRMSDPGYESTHTRTFGVPGSGLVYYYVRAENPTNFATGSPFNSGNTWPPPANLLALAATDPTGDAIDPEGNWVDLTGAYVGYSSDRFYGMLTNNHTSWPTYSFPQPWYIYSIGFVNPEAPSDTIAFSLSYANIPGVFTTGLYMINLRSASFTRIADIDAQTSGNKLYFRCLVSNFTNRPEFGPWPNTSGYLAVAANTQAIYPVGGSRLRDTTAGVNYYAGFTPSFTVNQNTPPELTNPTVEPRNGTPSTEFRFSVTYTDADNNLAVARSVVIDGSTFFVSPASHRYRDGVLFSRVLSKFSDGWHRFRFRFNDGMAVVETPLDSFYVGTTDIADAVGVEHRVGITPAVSRGLFRITAPPGTTVRVYAPSGRTALSSSLGVRNSSLTIDLRSMAPGVYYARVGEAPDLFRLTVVR